MTRVKGLYFQRKTGVRLERQCLRSERKRKKRKKRNSREETREILWTFLPECLP
jgi:hypothetical protein